MGGGRAEGGGERTTLCCSCRSVPCARRETIGRGEVSRGHAWASVKLAIARIRGRVQAVVARQQSGAQQLSINRAAGCHRRAVRVDRSSSEALGRRSDYRSARWRLARQTGDTKRRGAAASGVNAWRTTMARRPCRRTRVACAGTASGAAQAGVVGGPGQSVITHPLVQTVMAALPLPREQFLVCRAPLAPPRQQKSSTPPAGAPWEEPSRYRKFGPKLAR